MDDALAFSSLVLALSGHLVQEIHTRVARQGFEDLRPAHGFAFVRISRGTPPRPIWPRAPGGD